MKVRYLAFVQVTFTTTEVPFQERLLNTFDIRINTQEFTIHSHTSQVASRCCNPCIAKELLGQHLTRKRLVLLIVVQRQTAKALDWILLNELIKLHFQ